MQLEDVDQHASFETQLENVDQGDSSKVQLEDLERRSSSEAQLEDDNPHAFSETHLEDVDQGDSSEKKQGDVFVWPWMGVLVNVPTVQKDGRRVGESGTRIKEMLSRFNPLKVIPLWNYNGHTGNAIVDFSKDWNGFKDAMSFESYYKSIGCARSDWCNSEFHDPELYGWIARDEDYNSAGPIGDYLRKNGDLKTIDDLEVEEVRKRGKLLANLTNEIEVKKRGFKELESKYNETTIHLDKMMEERDKQHQAYDAEIQKMQCLARDHSRKIFEENEKLRSELESKRQELNLRCGKLDLFVAHNDADRSKLDEEKKKNAMMNNSLELAAMEQKRTYENVVRLLEEQKKEKEDAFKKMLHLEEQLDAKQKVELEIQQLEGSLKVMEHMGAEDSEAQKKMEELREELKEKIQEQEALEDVTEALVFKEKSINDELQEARKELIKGLKDVKAYRSTIGVKRMGELDETPFLIACKNKFCEEDVESKAAEICSFWQEEMKNGNWHPLKIINENGVTKQIMLDDDKRLKDLKEELGDDVCNAVITALKELNEYNASGMYVTPELWNFKESRRAELHEVIEYILRQWNTQRKKQ